MTDEAVLRLYRAIIERVRGRDTSSVTVGDLHEHIVPYSAVRSAIGVELNADYEHALLRLLAGERGLLEVEPATARRELREEARSPYPTVGLFRKFSDCRVHIRMPDEPWQERPSDPDSVPIEDDTVSDSDLASDRTPVPAPDVPHHPARISTPETPVDSASDECPFCGFGLPAGRPVRYCPGCGSDQRSRPCPRCGTALDPDWRYCISCGEPVTT
jgi:hypothetical protein